MPGVSVADHPRVSITTGPDPAERVRIAWEQLGAPAPPRAGPTVLLMDARPFVELRRTEVVPQAGTLEGLVRALRGARCRRLVLAVAGGARVAEALGLERLARRLRLGWVDLDRELPVEVALRDAESLPNLRLAETVAAAQAVVPLSVVRTGPRYVAPLCTAALTALAAPPQERRQFYVRFPEPVLDLAASLMPPLAVIDGTYGLDKSGRVLPARLDVTLLGTNVIATDAVGCGLMGLEPHRLDVLRTAGERRLGPIALDEIELVGEPLGPLRRRFML